MATQQYIVVVQQIVGSPESWSTQYSSDLKRYDERQAAIDAGWREFDHDDFNIGVLDGDLLVAFAWMDKDFGSGDYDLSEIAEQLGLEVSA